MQQETSKGWGVQEAKRAYLNLAREHRIKLHRRQHQLPHPLVFSIEQCTAFASLGSHRLASFGCATALPLCPPLCPPHSHSQVHYFSAPAPGKMYAKLNWRVSRPNGQFYERSDVQTFEQDPNAPGILYNHDNEFLHYQDDWCVPTRRERAAVSRRTDSWWDALVATFRASEPLFDHGPEGGALATLVNAVLGSGPTHTTYTPRAADARQIGLSTALNPGSRRKILSKSWEKVTSPKEL
jgi:hypothetical protein